MFFTWFIFSQVVPILGNPWKLCSTLSCGCSTISFNNGFCLGFNLTQLALSYALVARELCSSRVITPSIFSHLLSATSTKYFTYALDLKGHFAHGSPWDPIFNTLTFLFLSLWLNFFYLDDSYLTHHSSKYWFMTSTRSIIFPISHSLNDKKI
jgi:hypothetical protein